METRTRIVLLMHPMEFRHQKCNTGRLTRINLANSEIIQGIGFDQDARFRSLVEDPANYPVLLYPGKDAMSINGGRFPLPPLCGRTLVVFLIDATWHCARTIAKASPSLMRLPRSAIHPDAPSRYIIKRQPAAWCLSTLEATHELLLALEAGGLDVYPDKGRLIDAFNAMQDFQVRQIEKSAGSLALAHSRRDGQPVPATRGPRLRRTGA